MARVPVVIENEQRLAPLTRERFDAPDTTVIGRTIGAGLQRAGQALGRAAQDVDDINAIYDAARAKQADNEYQEFERNVLFGDDGYYSKQNADAVDAAPTTRQAIDTKIGELINRAQSPREKLALQDVLAQRRNQTFDGMGRYEQGEKRRFAITQSDARLSNAQEGYATYYFTDPERAAQYRATVLSELDQRLDLTGMHDAGIRKQAREEALSGMHKSVIEAEMMRDPKKADAYFQANKDEIDSATELSIDSRMFPLLADQDGREIAAMAAGSVVEVPGGRDGEGQPGPSSAAIKTLPRGWRAADAANITPVPNALSVAKQVHPGVNPTSWKRAPGVGKAGDKSWHVKSGAAVDVAPIKGMTFEQYVQGYRDAGYNVIEWIDETDPATAKKTGATGPHWHIVLGKGGQSSGGDAAQGTGAGGGTLQARLNWVETFVAERYGDKSPLFRQAVEDRAKSYIRQDNAEAEAAKRANEDAAWDSTLNQVDALGETFTNISQIKGYANLPPERRLQLKGMAEQNVRAAQTGTEPDTDWMFYGNLKRMAEENPSALRDVPIAEMRKRLGNTEFKEAMGWSTGKKVAPAKALTYDNVLGAAKSSLGAAGYATGDSKEAREDAAQVNGFMRVMMSWVARQPQPPTTEQIRKQADVFLIEGSWKVEGDRRRTGGRAFQAPGAGRQGGFAPNIPDHVRSIITKELGPNASGGDIAQYYVDGKRDGRW